MALLSVSGLYKSFSGVSAVDGVSFSAEPGELLCLLGPSGCGKTTMLRILAGVDQPDTGMVVPGHGLKVGYYAQEHETLDTSRTVLENMQSAAPQLTDTEARSVLGSFLFSGDDAHKPAKVLSGGEKTRLALASLVVSSANVLLLDEPSNDLDVETLRALEEALLDFPGSAIVISHDRWFLDRMATHILAFEGDSHVEWFEGDFSSYLEDKKRRLGEDAVNPKRLKFKKFAR